MLRSLIQLSAPSAVQPKWGEWLRRRDDRRDETSARRASGAAGGTNEQLSVGTVYGIAILLIAVANAVNTFSNARDISWRLGTPHNLWEPALWEITSGLVVMALLPIARRAALLIRSGTLRPLVVALAVVGLALLFSALHLIGMGFLREWAYGVAGWTYKFPWPHQIVYELRKDLFAFSAFVVIFWLAERPASMAPNDMVETEASDDVTAPPPQLWLRDGRTSILIDPREITSVISAGNYVEFQLTGPRNHLIRTTLRAQEARLAPFGVARVHRSRLVNLRRIVALEWRASGDFELRLDSGETFAGSRRFKAAVAGIAA
jgi:DNA-binding LytR/AlgR family response regulator